MAQNLSRQREMATTEDSTVMAQVDEWLQATAEEQGSASVKALKQNYVPEARLRELRRAQLADELTEAFEGGA